LLVGQTLSNFSQLTIGIDASRNRSGGAVAHLVGILAQGDPVSFGIGKIHVWSYSALLDAIPDRPWLIKHNPLALEKSLIKQLWWQRFGFPKEIKRAGCEIVLNTDAGTISAVRPAVTMSRDMLSYEPGVAGLFGLTKARLRILLLRYMQNRSLRAADGVIFLTRYASKVIQQSSGLLRSVAFIPHGVGEIFKKTTPINIWPENASRPIRCLYVSNTEMYKHQWVVVEAISILRKNGFDLKLSLVGGGKGLAQKLLWDSIANLDPRGEFIEQVDFLPQVELPTHLARADLFIFASSCENMPNTLVEAMAVGLPIACSNRGPMPEVLADGGVYFDPYNAISIANAVKQIIESPLLRLKIAQRAKNLSTQYSWTRCSQETWEFVTEVYRRIQN
jgi:glycosyltransferase involved in cell wall biosynthesis